MQSLKNIIKIYPVAAALVVSWLGFAGIGAASAEECHALVTNKCSACHFANYACRKIATNDGELSWKYTMHTMVEMGLMATDQEKEQLVRCLSKPDDKVKAICTQKK